MFRPGPVSLLFLSSSAACCLHTLPSKQARERSSPRSCPKSHPPHYGGALCGVVHRCFYSSCSALFNVIWSELGHSPRRHHACSTFIMMREKRSVGLGLKDRVYYQCARLSFLQTSAILNKKNKQQLIRTNDM